MIYIYSNRGKNTIILSSFQRDLKQDEDEVNDSDDIFKESNLLFTLDIDFNNQYIKDNLRRWLILWIKEDNFRCYKYRESIITWLKNIKEDGISNGRLLNYTPKLILEGERKRLINSFLDTKSFLVKNHIVEDESPVSTPVTEDMIEYNCDVYNYLEEVYPRLSNIISEYSMLGEKKKIAIHEFYGLKTRENQIAYLRTNGNIDVADLVDFLPDWCVFGLLISEDRLRKTNEKNDSDMPEFRNKNKIDDKDFLRRHKDSLIRAEIFRSFGINEVWTGNQIKEKIREIYALYEYTDGKPRISEINKYFEVNKTRQGYRIGFRKLTQYS